MNLAEYFALARGNQMHLAKALGTSPVNPHRWALRSKPIPASMGAAIERATGGAVTRQEMFPDTWASIWPELVRTPPVAPDGDTHSLILVELRKHTTLLEVLAKQGEENRRIADSAGRQWFSGVDAGGGVDNSGLPG